MTPENKIKDVEVSFSHEEKKYIITIIIENNVMTDKKDLNKVINEIMKAELQTNIDYSENTSVEGYNICEKNDEETVEPPVDEGHKERFDVYDNESIYKQNDIVIVIDEYRPTPLSMNKK